MHAVSLLEGSEMQNGFLNTSHIDSHMHNNFYIFISVFFVPRYLFMDLWCIIYDAFFPSDAHVDEKIVFIAGKLLFFIVWKIWSWIELNFRIYFSPP